MFRKLPPMRHLDSPQVVKIMDRIRRELDEEKYYEFYWFAREYPRCYRLHLDAADYRLKDIHAAVKKIVTPMIESEGYNNQDCFSMSAGFATDVNKVYWDFESYLSHTCTALDLLARVVGPAFKQQSPPSFSRLCKIDEDNEIVSILRNAKSRWVNRLKDYRDCFVHYTPVDTLLSIGLVRTASGWVARAKLPTNPNVREILGFRYSNRVELVKYAISVHRNMAALDKSIAKIIWNLHRSGRFPLRTSNLFFLGKRQDR